MIYIISVHTSKKWLALQIKQFYKHTVGDFEIHVGRRMPGDSMVISHCNGILEAMPKDFEGIDLMVVCDSDAFPVAPWDLEVREACSEHDFVAIQRLEHHRAYKREPPHPSFVAWIPSAGISFYIDETYRGPTVVDWKMKNWKKLNRMPGVSSVRCGIYGDMIYHHGFGSRPDDGFNGKEEYDRIEREFWKGPLDFIKKQEGGSCAS